jgi:hypothetical protein
VASDIRPELHPVFRRDNPQRASRGFANFCPRCFKEEALVARGTDISNDNPRTLQYSHHMPASKYRPIRDVKRNGSVSTTAIREAVRKIAELRQNDPAKYNAKIRSSEKNIHLVIKHS